MNELQRLKSLSEKIERLLSSVDHNGGKFTAIDKDFLTGYVREAYELAVGIPVQPATASAPVIENNNAKTIQPVKEEPAVMKPEKQVPVKNEVVAEKNVAEKNTSPADAANKKTLSDLYAVKKENGKATVNDRFKKEGMEIADKLKQTPIRDLKSYIGLNKQFAFMSKLFNADEQLYENAIAKLNGFKSYEEASGYIQNELLPSLHWSDDEPLVSEFFMLVMRRYLN